MRRTLLYALIASVVAFETLVLLLAVTPQGRTATRAILFIPQVLPAIPIKPQELFTPDPVRQRIEFPLAEGMAQADLYLPGDSGTHSAVLYYMGVDPPDRDEERIVRLGNALARSGVVLMIPWLDTQDQKRIVPDDIDGLVRGFRYLRSLEAVDPERVGVGGICTGASMTAIAAQDERIRDQVRFVHFFAGYYDAYDLVRAVGSRSRFYGDGVSPWNPHSTTMAVLTRHLIDGVKDADDQALLTRYFIDRKIRLDDDVGSLGQQGTAVYRLLEGDSPEEVDKLMAQLSPETIDFLERISPSTHIDDLRARVLIMHDRADRLVPSEESRRLADALGDESDTYHTEFSLFQSAIQVHEEESGGVGLFEYAGEAFKLYLHMYTVLRELS